MESLGIGKIIETEQHRDAVHMAIAPTVAAGKLSPGQRVAIVGEGAIASKRDSIGIVDPFLTKPVLPGERFWVFLYPGSITSLRHEWTHPAFESEPITESDREQAHKVFERLTGSHEKWLREFVNKLGTDSSYEHIMKRAAEGDGSMTFGDDISGEIPDEFWDHAEIVLGKKITQRAEYFSCSC